MSDLNSSNPITANGDYDVVTGDPNKARRWCVTALGTFGGGTVTFKHGDGTTFVSFKDSNGSAAALTADGGFEVLTNQPFIRVTVAGATTPSIKIGIEPVA